ncbi:uncharacterized protein DUF2490 [Ulvibacter sp. MAR_2010_11]|uniref:DUF2490 domain-containing protein n=1 Tax=Ulvibacter sp. MAR_2010_11 TaxID=1250229 RepID=UPI000C2B790F|nr:DUF2490 domain-containing protein [Ulvibacter sp. MAR_2010_11]PKA83878.1 uncharacterized protein DUF2490 [Ulvibacter sp. MAR_2010_11]
MLKQFVFLCIILISGMTRSIAQDSGEGHLGAWYILTGTHTLSDKLSMYTEIQCNLYEVTSNFEQFWALTSLDYHFLENAQASIGYGYFNGDSSFTDTQEEENTRENRVFEQFTHTGKLGKFTLQNRYRLEHRFIEKPLQSLTEHRIRGRLQITYPINDNWFLQGFDEVFINLQEPIFNQNRLTGTLGYKCSQNIKIQVGYMKIHFTGRSYDRLQLVLNINTDLRKKAIEKG